MPSLSYPQTLELAQNVLKKESEALLRLAESLDTPFFQACEYILACQGRVIVLGIGKSGHIAAKIAATLASTGTPAFFVHPAEARHGDLGMITQGDVALIVSNSGETEEILDILPHLKMLRIPMLVMSQRLHSSLARSADVCLILPELEEACPFGLTPTTSSTACLALGDALAIALLSHRGFSAQDFAKTHPGGNIGRRLIWRVSDLMHVGDALPLCAPQTPVLDTLHAMSSKRLGCVLVVGDDRSLLGIFTDGDLSRALESRQDLSNLPIASLMSKQPKVISEDMLAAEALVLMNRCKMTQLIVVDASQKVCGLIHMHDLLQKGFSLSNG